MRAPSLALCSWTIALAACGADPGQVADGPVASDTSPDVGSAEVGGNVLFLLTDDQGIDKVAAYGAHPQPPRTPVIDALAADGVLFRRAYAAPVCSPTRAALLTGRYNRRYGLGEVIHPSKSGFALRDREYTLAEALTDAGYHAEALGKWHLAGFTSSHATQHPNAMGFARYAGAYGNVQDEKAGTGTGIGTTHYYWQKTVDGELDHVLRFSATDTVDDAIARIEEMPEPWFLYVAFNAPHTPLTLAPDHLHDQDIQHDSTKPEKVAALVESLDTEIGRLLDSMDPEVRARTTIVFMSDNGSYAGGVLPPWRGSHAKNTPFEGGIRVPLIVSGPAVSAPGRSVDALVHAVDLFPTVVELAGVDPGTLVAEDGAPLELDGVSIVPYLEDPATPPLREYVYTGKFGPNGGPGPVGDGYNVKWDIVLDARWKLVRGHGPEALYDLENPGTEDGLEGENLLNGELSPEAREAYDRLTAELEAIEARAPYESGP